MLRPVLLSIAILSSYSASAKELILNSPTTAPLSNKEQTGFVDSIASEAFRRIGIKLKIIQLPAERALRYSNSGEIDGELLRIRGLDKVYPNLIRIPEKVMNLEFTAFSNKSISIDRKWKSLSQYSITFLNGWKIYEINVPTASHITKVNKPQQLFSLLLKNRADLALYERWGGLYYIKQNKLKYIKQVFPVLAEKEMFLYLHKKHISLIKPLTIALKKIKQDGSYKAIKDKILTPLERY